MKHLLDLEALSTIPSLFLRAKAIAEGGLSGIYKAKRYGGSAEFAEHRLYAPGDELRTIDWKVFGRVDKYYVRKFEEEKNLIILLCVDASSSMSYGKKGRSKFDFAIHLAAAFAYLFSQDHHSIGLSFFGGEAKEHFLPPRTQREHLQRVFTTLESAKPKDSFDVISAFREIAERQKRKALVFFFSDLLSFDEEIAPEEQKNTSPLQSRALQPLNVLSARGHDVIVFHVLHPDEMSFPYQDMVEFEDLEIDKNLLVDASGIRDSYQKEMREFLQNTQQFCERFALEYHQTQSNKALNQALQLFFTQRRKANF